MREKGDTFAARSPTQHGFDYNYCILVDNRPILLGRVVLQLRPDYIE